MGGILKMPLFLCDREFVSDQRWRVDMNEFYEELKKVLDLSDGDVWKNKMKDRTKRKRKTEKKADVKARAESSVNESEEFPVL